MNRNKATTSTFAVLLLGTLVSPALAQTPREPYPVMAPLAQYLMPDRDAEIQLARSAAPPSISDHASVQVLGPHGYETAAQGTNGFVCIVERAWMSPFDDPQYWNPRLRGPLCFNPPAVRSVLPLTYKRTELALAGFTRAQILAGIKDAFNRKELPTLEAGAMSYMMSNKSYLGDGIGHGDPHLMFYALKAPGTPWGENLPDSPVFLNRQFLLSAEPLTCYIVGVSTWSDGTPAPTDEDHKH